MGIDPTKNFALVNQMRRDCPKGYEKRYLDPNKRCKEQFTIGTGSHLLGFPSLPGISYNPKIKFVY